MSGKFITCKRIMIPVLSLIMMLSQATQAFAITPEEIANLMQHTPTISLEIYDGQMPSTVLNDSEVIDLALNKAVTAGQLKASLEEFTDIKPTDWFYESVIDSYKQGLIKGVGHGLFAPKNVITNAEYLTTLARLIKSGDKNIPNIANSKNWYDKYIKICQEEGIIASGKKVNYTDGITRQDMMEFTCRALKLEPTTDISKVIFADVDERDAKYINLSYLEYLTEGTGRNANGQKIFGYNTYASRSELATMILRVKEYKTDPQAFKEVKAAARQTADTKYAEEASKYTIVNGYKIPNDLKQQLLVNGRHEANYGGEIIVFDITLRAGWERETEKAAVQDILASKHGDAIAKQVMDYARTKKLEWVDIEKEFKTSTGYTISVRSLNGNPIIGIVVVAPSK